MTSAQLAIAWVRAKGAAQGVTVIPTMGARTRKQLEDAARRPRRRADARRPRRDRGRRPRERDRRHPLPRAADGAPRQREVIDRLRHSSTTGRPPATVSADTSATLRADELEPRGHARQERGAWLAASGGLNVVRHEPHPRCSHPPSRGGPRRRSLRGRAHRFVQAWDRRLRRQHRRRRRAQRFGPGPHRRRRAQRSQRSHRRGRRRGRGGGRRGRAAARQVPGGDEPGAGRVHVRLEQEPRGRRAAGGEAPRGVGHGGGDPALRRPGGERAAQRVRRDRRRSGEPGLVPERAGRLPGRRSTR